MGRFLLAEKLLMGMPPRPVTEKRFRYGTRYANARSLAGTAGNHCGLVMSV